MKKKGGLFILKLKGENRCILPKAILAKLNFSPSHPKIKLDCEPRLLGPAISINKDFISYYDFRMGCNPAPFTR